MPKKLSENAAEDLVLEQEINNAEYDTDKDAREERILKRYGNDPIVDLHAATLTGDIRDAILGKLRHIRTTWAEMPEIEQRALAADVNLIAEDLVKKTVNLIASQGRRVIHGKLESVAVKKEIKAVITLRKEDENRHDLFDSAGESVLIVVASPEAFIGQSREPEIDLDQPSLLEGEYEPDFSNAEQEAEAETEAEVE